jgi:hypothetical protein
MKSAEEQRRLDLEATIRDLRIRMNTMEQKMNKLLERLGLEAK